MSQSSIDYIELRGYKSIRDSRIEIRPINVLIGANGSGKSNFLSFFDFLRVLYEQNLREYVSLRGGEEKFLFCGKKTTPELYFHVEFNGNGYSAMLQVGDNGFVFVEENLLYREQRWNIAQYGSEAGLKDSDMYRAPYIRTRLSECRKFHFHDTGRNSPFTQASHIEKDSFYLYADGRNIAAFLYKIEQKAKPAYTLIRKTIQSIAPYFSDFLLIPNENGFLKLDWKDKYNDVRWGASDLSDGTLRFIALATLFLQPNLPSVIVIDEPELGLHPFAIAKLAGLIRSAAQRGSQIIVATQSAELINHFSPEDILTVDLVDGASQFQRLESKELAHWLAEYSLGELWERDILSNGHVNF
jgi:hypothetical protein